MKTKMILLASLGIAGLALSAGAQISSAYWNFNSESTVVTAETMPGTPTLSYTGTPSSFSNFSQAPTYVAFDGSSNPGSYALSWNPNSAGNSFTLGLNLSGLENLQMRLDYRGTSSVGFASFSAIEYSLDGGGSFVTAITSPTLTQNSNFQTLDLMDLDFSAVTAIEGQSDVQIRFSFANVPGGNSFRIDNLELVATAIPEPSTYAMIAALCALGLVGWYRRCR